MLSILQNKILGFMEQKKPLPLPGTPNLVSLIHSEQLRIGHAPRETARQDNESSSGTEIEASEQSARWSPWTLRTPYLMFVVCVSLALFIFLEVLRKKSIANQGLVFVKDTDEITGTQFFAYNYLPTLVAVIYSGLWLLIDSDVKRMEPYFQMSKPNCSLRCLYLDYAFETTHMVPYQAWRNKHWLVSITTLVNLLVALILPAMCNGLFTLAEIMKLQHDEMFVRASLQENPAPSPRPDLITGEFAIRANLISEYGLPLPTFTTEEYALAPFILPEKNQAFENDTWTGESVIYWTEPHCRVVEDFSALFANSSTVEIESESQELFIQSHTRFKVSQPQLDQCSMETVQRERLLAIGQEDRPDLSGHWASIRNHVDNITDSKSWFDVYNNTECGRSTSFAILMVQANNSKSEEYFGSDFFSSAAIHTHGLAIKAFATVCNPMYFKSVGNATFLISNGTVLSIDESNINRTRTSLDVDDDFLDLAYQGINNLRQQTRAVHTSSNDILNTLPLSLSTGLDYLVMNRILSSPEQLTEKIWAEELSRAVKLVFAVGILGLVELNKSPEARLGMLQQARISIKVTNTLAILSETLLCLSAVVSLCLCCAYMRRRCKVSNDPDSIAGLCSLLANFTSLLNSADNERQSHKHLNSKKYTRKEADCDSTQFVIPGSLNADFNHMYQPTISRLHNYIKPGTVPAILKAQGLCWSLFTYFIVLSATSCLLIFSKLYGGFSYLASSSPLIMQLLWSFCPGIIATFISALWTNIHRDISLLEPWIRLDGSQVMSREAMLVKYSSRNPYAIMPQAFQHRHWVVILVSCIWLSTLVLNISMGGLFSQSFSTVSNDFEYRAIPWRSNLTNIDADSWFISDESEWLALLNVTEGEPLDTWTDEKFSFVPVEFEPVQEVNALYQVKTLGFGARLSCQTAGPPQPLNETTELKGWTYNLNQTNEQREVNCNISDLSTLSDYTIDWQSILIQSSVPIIGAHTLDKKDEHDLCNSRSFIVSSQQGTLSHDTMETIDHAQKHILCQPFIQEGYFELVVKENGQIVSFQDSFTHQEHENFVGVKEYLALFQSRFSLDASVNRRLHTVNGSTLSTSFDLPGLMSSRLHWIYDNDTSLLDEAILETHISRVYSLMFSVVFSDHRRWFDLAPEGAYTTRIGTVFTREARVVAFLPFFTLTITILVFHIIALAVVYVKRRGKFLGPWMPSSIGSIIPWVAGTQMLNTFEGTQDMNNEQLNNHVRGLKRCYKFGWYDGAVGKRLLLEHADVFEAGEVEIEPAMTDPSANKSNRSEHQDDVGSEIQQVPALGIDLSAQTHDDRSDRTSLQAAPSDISSSRSASTYESAYETLPPLVSSGQSKGTSEDEGNQGDTSDGPRGEVTDTIKEVIQPLQIDQRQTQPTDSI